MTHYNVNIKFIGLEILRQKASPSAAHDASARYPPPRCASGTREKVVADIMEWIKDPSPNRSILWLNGPFGNGKSAIMQTISEVLHRDSRLSHLFAASFFFGRGMDRRDKAEYLIPTIAYQIAISDPRMRKLVDKALTQDPFILDKSIGAQLRCLITNPLQEVARDPSSSGHFHSPTVIIDGLDECDGHDFQRNILNTISTAVLTDHVQLRFLIASRPESQISETFHTQPLNHHHYHITLDNDCYVEMKQFLRSTFDEMCERRHDLMFVEHPWPSETDLSTLAHRASGQFLYANTVVRFVDSDMAHPTHQLALILKERFGNVAAFSSMDDLYTQILESCHCQKNLLRLLSAIQCLRLISLVQTVADLAVMSGLELDNVLVILRCLPAIFRVEWLRQQDLPDGWPRQGFTHLYSPEVAVHHISFIEFLFDKSRSKKFHVDENAAHREARARLDILVAKCLSTKYGIFKHSEIVNSD